MSELTAYPLGPFSGMDLRRVDDRNVAGTAQRGGYNVAVVDGEWWSRGGLRGYVAPMAGPMWRHMWNDPQTSNIYWISPYCVIRKMSDGSGFKFPYTQGVTDTITLVNGVNLATAGGARTVGEMFEINGTIYRITNVAGANITLHRDAASNGAFAGTQILSPFNAVALDAGNGTTRTGFTIFFQGAAHLANALYAGAPATFRSRYMVCTYENGEPVAFDLDTVRALVTGFARRTSQSGGPPASLGNVSYCTTYRDRLILGRLNDASGANPTRTFWDSEPLDFCLWHSNGVTGVDAQDNFTSVVDGEDTISALAIVRGTLVVHKAKSQVLVDASGAGEFGFTLTRNNQGLGVRENASDSSVVVDGLNYFWSAAGPAVFDGQQVTLLRPDLHLPLQAKSATPAAYRILGMADEEAGIITWFLNGSAPMPPLLTKSMTAVCFDYRRNQWWLYDLPDAPTVDPRIVGCGAGYLAMDDGNGLKLNHIGGLSKDAYVLDDPPYEAVTRCRVATPWMTLGSEEQKNIHRIDFYVRSLEELLGVTVYGTGYQDLLGSTAQLGLRCEIYTDLNLDAPAQTLDVPYSPSGFPPVDELGQEPRQIVEIPAHVTGRQFRFVFDNEPIAGTSTWARAPFRLSQVVLRLKAAESSMMER